MGPVATSSVGTAGSIVVSGDTGPARLPVTISLCQTNPKSSASLAPSAASAAVNIGANATPMFAIFVTTTGAIPFDPGSNRAFVRFNDASGVTRGATSVTVRTQ